MADRLAVVRLLLCLAMVLAMHLCPHHVVLCMQTQPGSGMQSICPGC